MFSRVDWWFEGGTRNQRKGGKRSKGQPLESKAAMYKGPFRERNKKLSRTFLTYFAIFFRAISHFFSRKRCRISLEQNMQQFPQNQICEIFLKNGTNEIMNGMRNSELFAKRFPYFSVPVHGYHDLRNSLNN